MATTKQKPKSNNTNIVANTGNSGSKTFRTLLWDFFGKVVVSAMLWVCVGVGLMLYPVLAYNTGGTKQFPTFAPNIAIFYDERLAWSVLGGGIILCLIFAIVNVILRKIPNKKALAPGEESMFTMSMSELSSQFVGFASLLLASSVFYWVDRELLNTVFDPKTRVELLFTPSILMFALAFLIYWLAYAENHK